MHLQRVLACALLLAVVCHPARTVNINRLRRPHQKHSPKSQNSQSGHRILEKNRAKNIIVLKPGIADNWGLPKVKAHEHWSGSQKKNGLLERAPQVDKIMVNEHFLTINNFNNSDYNMEHCRDPKYKIFEKQEYGCQPRETIVHFIHSGGYKLSPNAVSVMRCDGMCEGYSKCIPSGNKTKRFYIRQIHNNEVSCGTIEVEEHTKCSCSCPERPNDCQPPDQEYDTEECKCKCKPKTCPAKQLLDDNDCQCKCKKQRKCSTGSHFDVNKCRCIKNKKIRTPSN